MRGLDVDRWVLAFMLSAWLISNVGLKWAVAGLSPSGYGGQQDIYVLVRR